MRTLALCDEAIHPADLRWAGLGNCGHKFAWQEDSDGWSAEQMNEYSLVSIAYTRYLDKNERA